MKIVSVLTLLFSISSSSSALAWGNRGHFTVCEAAVFLVKDKTLASFLKQKMAIMGHLCNVPDTHWKNLGPEINKQGSAAHYVDPEILGTPLKDLPLDYKKLIEQYQGTKNVLTGSTIHSIPLEFGSNWWRADQFYRRAVAAGKEWIKVEIPKSPQEEQDDSHAFNRVSVDFYISLGLMGHFVGDNGQPFHATADFDGYGAGHGGIHAYFEDSIVAEQPYTFLAKIVEEGLKLQKKAQSKDKSEQKEVAFLKEKTVLERMRSLAELSLADVPKVYALDLVEKPSIRKKEKGMSLKTPAKRALARTVADKFQNLLVVEIARSATLLAQLWDEAYIEAGQPKLNSYKSYKYPFTPDFVPPDYFDVGALEKTK